MTMKRQGFNLPWSGARAAARSIAASAPASGAGSVRASGLARVVKASIASKVGRSFRAGLLRRRRRAAGAKGRWFLSGTLGLVQNIGTAVVA